MLLAKACAEINATRLVYDRRLHEHSAKPQRNLRAVTKEHGAHLRDSEPICTQLDSDRFSHTFETSPKYDQAVTYTASASKAQPQLPARKIRSGSLHDSIDIPQAFPARSRATYRAIAVHVVLLFRSLSLSLSLDLSVTLLTLNTYTTPLKHVHNVEMHKHKQTHTDTHTHTRTHTHTHAHAHTHTQHSL